jgi:hypothetical protein
MTIRAIRFADTAEATPREGAAPGRDGFAERTPLPAAALAAAAARGFSAGNGFLTGQIVDRCA